MKSQIPTYVPRLLKEYGNAVISSNLVKRIGSSKILELLKTEEGIDANLHTISDHSDVQFCAAKKKGNDITYILEVNYSN